MPSWAGTERDARAVAVVGVGARCAVGLHAHAAAAAVRAGLDGFAEHPYMIDRVGEPMVVASEPTLDTAMQGPQRFAALAEPALVEALAPLAALGTSLPPVHVLIGTPEARPGLPDGINAALERLVGTAIAPPVQRPPRLLPRGHAAGLLAIGMGCEMLVAGEARLCLAGGVDSYLTADCLEWMDEQGMLKSSENRNGFVPGEAAGFCLMASGATAHALGLPILAWVDTTGRAVEQHCIRTATICVGRGLSDAIGQALSPLQMPQDRVDESICDLNGEPYRSEEFAFTVLRTQKSFVDFSRFVTPADCWGDVGAASGPLFAGLAVAAHARGYAKGPRTMLWASSVAGDRAAVVLRGSSLAMSTSAVR